MPEIPLDRIPGFAELTAWMHHFADEYPELVELDVLGRSWEGREIWIATVTNVATGRHQDKPAVWIDGNIHAVETTSSAAIVQFLRHLCRGYDTDARIRRALDTRTFYLVPRVNPDGAELALGELPSTVRSNTRPWPVNEQLDGLVPGDVDRDGRQLQMRIEDPNGAWTPSGIDPRLMVEREPDDHGDGPFYRLLSEGSVIGFDGSALRAAPALAGVDSNRNFPYHWRREPGHGGDFPASEPEVEAIVRGVVERKNIGSYLTYHTFAGMHLRPYGDRADDAFPTEDLRIYEEFGRRATALTGYPALSTAVAFRYDPKVVHTGMSIDWAYGELGLCAWVTEFWNPLRAAGMTPTSHVDWYTDHPFDDELRLLAWVDEEVVDGCVDWYEYDHPQLGPVELGGWNTAAVFWNPPGHLLEAEITPHHEIALLHALSGPLLQLRNTQVTRLGDGTWHLRVDVENNGWLPTNITRQAVDQGAVQPVVAQLTLPAGARLVSGTERLDLGQLTGRSAVARPMRQFAGIDESTDRAPAEWIIAAPAGTAITVEIRHDRAGVVRTDVVLQG